MASEPDNLNQDDSTHPPGAVTIKIFSTTTAAEAAAALLEANEIICWLHADDCGGMLSVLDTVHGVKLLVRPGDATEAKTLLAAVPVVAANLPPEDLSTAAPDSTPPPPRIKLSLFQIAAGIVLGVLLCLLYQWTSHLGIKTYRYDTDGDGKKDTVWIYRDGECVEIDEDRNFDGILDSWVSYTNGYRCASAKADYNFDGTPDAWWYYTNGILASAQLDTDFNGIPDVKSYFKYGQFIRSDWQPNGTNIVVRRDVFHYEVLTEELRDTNWDGLFDLRIRYDAFHNPIATNASR